MLYVCQKVLLHLRSFFNNFVCAYHTLARIKLVHLHSVLVLHLRVYFHLFLGQLLGFYKVLELLPLFTDLVISLFGLSQGSATAFLFACLSQCLPFYGSILFYDRTKNHGIFKISSPSCFASFFHASPQICRF